MVTYDLDFQYKADRTYVHGTDIFNSVAELINDRLGLGGFNDINMTLHRIIRNNLSAEVHSGLTQPRPADAAVAISFSDGAGQRHLLFLKEANRKVTGRYEYDEDGIIGPAKIDKAGRAVTLETRSPYTDIELIVALNKGLLKALFPDAAGKWYFTRLQFDRYSRKTNYKCITIRLLNHAGLKLTKSSIQFDGVPRGAIYFSQV
ncbi:MAG TPA: hypothetical protein P5308_05305 [Syntrophales bacterium]|nr:hypothetical protein [Syntrophales bacterium]